MHKIIFTDNKFKYWNKVDYNRSVFYRIFSQFITNAIKKQNSEVIDIKEPQNLKVRPMVEVPKCLIRKLGTLTDSLFEPFCNM